MGTSEPTGLARSIGGPPESAHTGDTAPRSCCRDQVICPARPPTTSKHRISSSLPETSPDPCASVGPHLSWLLQTPHPAAFWKRPGHRAISLEHGSDQASPRPKDRAPRSLDWLLSPASSPPTPEVPLCLPPATPSAGTPHLPSLTARPPVGLCVAAFSRKSSLIASSFAARAGQGSVSKPRDGGALCPAPSLTTTWPDREPQPPCGSLAA